MKKEQLIEKFEELYGEGGDPYIFCTGTCESDRGTY